LVLVSFESQKNGFGSATQRSFWGLIEASLTHNRRRRENPLSVPSGISRGSSQKTKKLRKRENPGRNQRSAGILALEVPEGLFLMLKTGTEAESGGGSTIVI